MRPSLVKMDSTLNQFNFFSKVSPIDVTQLDKINAIHSKNRKNLLLDGLCQEDQIYLNALTEDSDSSDTDEDDVVSQSQLASSSWSPMAQSPRVMNKRIKRLKPSYEITLSLENISYIRPSWGQSKELEKKKRAPKKVDAKKKENELGTKRLSFHLILFGIVVICFTLPPYLIKQSREQSTRLSRKVSIDDTGRIFEVYRPNKDFLDPILRASLGEHIPRDLRPHKCDCQLYSGKDSLQEALDDRTKQCIACFDWAFRANLRVFLEGNSSISKSKTYSEQDEGYCYRVKWQTYNTLISAPLVDCFLIGDDEIWHGIGDLQSANVQLNKLLTGWTIIRTNLSADFVLPHTNWNTKTMDPQLLFGSWVNLSLFTSNRIFLGKISTDFDLAMKISYDHVSGFKRLCLRASCTDKCSRNWLRGYHLDRLRHKNNFLDYTICSAANLDTLLSIQLSHKVNSLKEDKGRASSKPTIHQRLQSSQNHPITTERSFPEGVGLIERLIFTTSIEFLPILNGLTIRKFADDIVKLDLKSSLILMIDTRWETHVGSLKLNSALFPKAKLLLDILHNKGFKIIFTVRPYVDAIVGINAMSELVDANRIYATNMVDNGYMSGVVLINSSLSESNNYLVRRKSFFETQPQTINIRLNQTSKFPFFFKCKESLEGFCTIYDLTLESNREWMIGNIRRTELLALGADGIRIGGMHPNPFAWDDHYRSGLSDMIRNLLYNEKIYTIPRWTGDFGYIEVAPRPATWDGLRSVLNSVLNLGMLGYSLVHPGSVWGDIKSKNFSSLSNPMKVDLVGVVDQQDIEIESEEELAARWVQMFTFMPIMQFNNLNPIEKFRLQELIQNLVKLRRTIIVPELKRHLPYTPLISPSNQQDHHQDQNILPLIRPVWSNQDKRDAIVDEQFMIGPDIVVAPILSFRQRQRDIYLPNGYWHDELRHMSVRGGKWLLNYPVEISEIAWFTRHTS